jgi:hypothetical protein
LSNIVPGEDGYKTGCDWCVQASSCMDQLALANGKAELSETQRLVWIEKIFVLIDWCLVLCLYNFRFRTFLFR